MKCMHLVVELEGVLEIARLEGGVAFLLLGGNGLDLLLCRRDAHTCKGGKGGEG